LRKIKVGGLNGMQLRMTPKQRRYGLAWVWGVGGLDLELCMGMKEREGVKVVGQQ